MRGIATNAPHTWRNSWLLPHHGISPRQASDKPARNICTPADRRGAKSNSEISSGRKRDGGNGFSGADERAAEMASRNARGRELQRAARRASARAEGVGGIRLALQERLSSQQASEEEEGDWAAVAAAATGRGGGSGRGASTPLTRPRNATGISERAGSSRGGAAASGRSPAAAWAADGDELWPSPEVVAGPMPLGADAATAAADTATQSGGSGGAGVVGGPPGLVRALRAAQAFDRQGRMMTGGGGLLGAAAAPGQAAANRDGDDEDLAPYADVALKELGLPPRQPAGRGQNRQQQRDRSSARGGSRDVDDDDNQEKDDSSGGGVRRNSSAGPSRGRGAKRGALRELLAAYQRVWCRALDLELQEEWTESEQRLKSWRRPRLEAEGYALFDLNAAPDHNLFRDAVLRFFVPGRPLPYHCLGAGDIVLVSPNNRPSEASLEGVVLDFSGRWIRVALPADMAHGVQGSGWRLDLYANTIAHERARGAVKRYCQAAADSGNSNSSGNKGDGKGTDDEGAGGRGGGSLGILRALAGSVPPGASLEQMAAAAPSWLRGKAGRERLTAARRVVAAAAVVGGDLDAEEGEEAHGAPAVAAVAAAALPVPDGVAVSRAGGRGPRRRRAAGLNPSQARAIETALGRSLTLWQGPPGTGKTATLLHFIRAATAALPPGAGPLLATAASNVAVDNLVSGLRALDPSLDVVRVGQPVKVAPELRGVSLEARIAGTAAGQRAARLRRQAQGLRGSEAWAFISQALELEEGAARDILSRARVVAATCIGCGEARMQALSFPVVVLDEATQATEPHSLVPLLGQVQQLVLVGDPQQLPPTVKSQQAAELGLQLPLFERLQLMGISPLLLDTQYRMHPAIASFPSAVFYGGRLRSAPSPRDRRPPATFPWPNPQVPVCFIPICGREARTAAANDAGTPGGAAGFSYHNDDEAAAVVEVVAVLLTQGSGLDGPGDIGVVTPYNGQVRCLQQLLTRGSRLASSAFSSRGPGLGTRPGSFLRRPPTAAADGDDDGGGPVGAGSDSASVLEIKSVDGFQGREKEVIVFSAVRSNPEGRLGFVADSRRLNVAITRARRGLVVVGNPDTLGRDRLWARWLRWVEGQGCVMQGGWLRAAAGPGRGGSWRGGLSASAGTGAVGEGRVSHDGGEAAGAAAAAEEDEEGFVALKA